MNFFIRTNAIGIGLQMYNTLSQGCGVARSWSFLSGVGLLRTPGVWVGCF